jgi:hypothetical protein
VLAAGAKCPGQLLQELASSQLLDIHDTMCQSFANSPNLFFLAGDGYIVRNVSFAGAMDARIHDRELYCFVGCVSGQQQGQVRKGDELVGLDGSPEVVFFHPSQNSLVARVRTKQSEYLKRDLRDQFREPTRVVINID